MSTLKADTIVASDGSSPVTPTKQSACKAMLNMKNNDSPPTIRSSFNHSSLVDNAQGDHDINFTNNFSDADYYPAAIAGQGADNTLNNTVITSSMQSSGTTRIFVTRTDNEAVVERNRIAHTVHGDLA